MRTVTVTAAAEGSQFKGIIGQTGDLVHKGVASSRVNINGGTLWIPNSMLIFNP